jgi:hypothetical protein
MRCWQGNSVRLDRASLPLEFEGGIMSEDQTESLGDYSIAPVPFEEYVRRQFESLHASIAGLRAETVERFLQVSRQVREVNEKVEELDEKIDVFIKEQIHIKRDLRDVRESLTPKS